MRILTLIKKLQTIVDDSGPMVDLDKVHVVVVNGVTSYEMESKLEIFEEGLEYPVVAIHVDRRRLSRRTR